MKVLTVDDSKTIRLLVKRYLQPLKLEICEASDGREGIEKAVAEKPDLIILDVTMPIMDGQQALAELRKNPETVDIPVIMLTAESRREMVVSLIELGISDYIVKPFNAETLCEKVNAVFSGNSSEDDAEETAEEDSNRLPRVLVLDDKANVLDAARKFLEGKASVVSSTCPDEAVSLADAHRPDLALLDLVIPGRNVFETFSILRASENLKKTRFVAMAIRTMQEEAASARKAGFHDVIIKPFSEKTIANVLKANLAGSRNLLAFETGYAVFQIPPFSENSMAISAFAQQVLRKAESALHDVADSGYENLLLDMSESEQADMSLVSCVSTIQKTANDLGVELKVTVPDPGMSRMLKQFSETGQMTFYNSIEEAAQAFAGQPA